MEPLNAINILNNVLLRKPVISKLSRYDLLLGVVKAEAYFAFNSEDVQYGIEADRRSKILRTFVRNTYSYHLSEILATIVNEYTDWERPVQHPINIRDETLEALSDAQYVAPVVHTADLHSAEHKNSYLYVFDYQTKFGDYQQVRKLLNMSSSILKQSIWNLGTSYVLFKTFQRRRYCPLKNKIPKNNTNYLRAPIFRIKSFTFSKSRCYNFKKLRYEFFPLVPRVVV